jgi:hypothetical protein
MFKGIIGSFSPIYLGSTKYVAVLIYYGGKYEKHYTRRNNKRSQ